MLKLYLSLLLKRKMWVHLSPKRLCLCFKQFDCQCCFLLLDPFYLPYIVYKKINSYPSERNDQELIIIKVNYFA